MKYEDKHFYVINNLLLTSKQVDILMDAKIIDDSYISYAYLGYYWKYIKNNKYIILNDTKSQLEVIELRDSFYISLYSTIDDGVINMILSII